MRSILPNISIDDISTIAEDTWDIQVFTIGDGLLCEHKRGGSGRLLKMYESLAQAISDRMHADQNN